MAPSPDERLTDSARAVPEPVGGAPEAPASSATQGEGPVPAPEPGFRVSLSNFDGPFDLLLSLLSKHELDITEVSLSLVTTDFIAYLRQLDPDEELDQASEFLVVAATLLDMKVAGLLPQGELVDAFGPAVLETVISRTVKFPDASVAATPITSFAPDHPAAEAYRTLARELIVRGAVA